MPTKTKTPARKRVRVTIGRRVATKAEAVAAVTDSPKLKPAKGVRVHLHPLKAEFFNAGEGEPYSRLAYGPEGSDARAKVDAALTALESQTVAVECVEFDAQGKEVAFAS